LTSVTLDPGALPELYAPATSTPQKSASPSATTAGSTQEADSVQLSPTALREVALTGRISVNEQAGNLSGAQAQQLYGQLSSIHSQIATDRQAGGGTLSPTQAQAIQQSENQLSQTVYSDAHGGAAPPSSPHVSPADAREALEAGRITLNAKAGNLSSDQADQLTSQLGTIHQQIETDKQANGGTLTPPDAQAINQLQNQLSEQIYTSAH
jgi:hypothetical protein